VGILLTAYTDLPVLIDALNSGAVERYVQKPWDSKELSVILRQAISTFATSSGSGAATTHRPPMPRASRRTAC